MATYWYLGSTPHVTATVTDNNGVPLSPDSLVFACKDPAGANVPLNAATTTGTGVFDARVTSAVNVGGVYSVYFTVTENTDIQTGGYRFTVLSTLPVTSTSDLASYMGVSTVDTTRAQMLLATAQGLCETVVSPLPAGAEAVVLRMAALAYASPTGGRPTRLGSLQIEYGAAANGSGVVLSSADQKELRRLSGGSSGAFSFDLIPADALTTLPPWDVDPVITVAP